MNFSTDPQLADHLDQQDELAHYQEQFVFSDPETIYLDGNSLGRLPKKSVAEIEESIHHQWGERLIRSWNEDWIHAAEQIGGKIAKLMGAQPDEVIVTDSTSANLFKLTVAALQARPGRKKIVSDAFNFPSDLYIFQGVIDLLEKGHHLELIPSIDSISISHHDLESRIDQQTALVALTHVAFKSAFMYDMERVTELVHQANAVVLWDLCHSIGAVPLALNQWGVDLAVGCTYKYLNGGPGSPAFIYVRKDLQNKLMQPIWGWFAAKSPFDFDLDFTPAEGIKRYQVSTPPVLSMKALEPAVDILLEAGIDRLRKKSICQTEYLIYLAQAWLLPLGFSLGTPVDSAHRGSHVSIRHPEAFRICRAMIESDGLKIIPDFRTPDNIRLGIAPIYTTFTDIYLAMVRIKEIVENKIYEQFSVERLAVT